MTIRDGGRAVTVAIIFSFALQGAIALVGSLLGGYFGTPIPDGDSSGITFDLLGGFSNFSWLLFAVDVVLTAVPLYLVIRPFPAGRLGVLVSLVLFAVLVACGPLVLVVFGYDVNWWPAAINVILAALAARLVGVVDRDPPVMGQDR